jgi:hypothetical protein
VRAALGDWQATGCVRFREAPPGGEGELLFSWARAEHGACVPFGADPSVAHAGPVGPGTWVHFDAQREWDGDALRRAALHEIGHVLGLDHSPDERAVMFPEPARARRRLSGSDLAALHSLYGGGQDSPGDLVVERLDGEPVLTLRAVAPRELARWSVLDCDGDGAGEILVWRTDRAGHGATWEYRFERGPLLARALGPRYGLAPRGEEPESGQLRADLDGDGVPEVVRLRE